MSASDEISNIILDKFNENENDDDNEDLLVEWKLKFNKNNQL